MRFVPSLLLVATALLVGTVPAAAASEVCVSLQARLAVLDRGISGFGGDRELDRAILNQRQEFDRATVAARRAGCLGGLFSAPKPASSCAASLALIERMKDNLARLNAERRRVSPNPALANRERAGVLRQLAMHQCGSQYAAYGPAPPRRSLFSGVFGRLPIRGGFGAGGFYFEDPSDHGTYRTLCVRTCDGYYFPISFSTVPAKFADDERTCRALCPAADAALFVHRNPGEDAEAMMSLAGEAYLSLPTAFRYRQHFDAACTCGAAEARAAVPFLAPSAAATPRPDAAVPLPLSRPAGEDPETAMNRAGGFVPGASGLPGEGPGAAPRAVRVVGPAAYIAQ